jgi:hypothetical protein
MCQIGKNVTNGPTIYPMEHNKPNWKQYTIWSYNIPNGPTIYQMVLQYTKWSYNIPKGPTIYTNVQYTNENT